jgi:hypothetical protein
VRTQNENKPPPSTHTIILVGSVPFSKNNPGLDPSKQLAPVLSELSRMCSFRGEQDTVAHRVTKNKIICFLRVSFLKPINHIPQIREWDEGKQSTARKRGS